MAKKELTIKQGKESSKVTKIIKGVVTVLFLLALLFVPAGTLNWPEAWVFLIFYFLFVSGAVIWMKKNDPDLLRERTKIKKDVKGWDKNIMRAYTSILIILVAVTGFDSVRFRWSQVPFALKTIGFLVIMLSAGMFLWVMKENTYLSNMVRIQKDRQQKVCTTGPYKYIRHPMYLGIILFMLFFPVYLGSFYALIPGLIIVILFILRTSLEDKTLQKELPGYQEYAKKVRYKLIPKVW
jgi:protein-S-isoprenylcysteine O-methyltransferase Ste14